MKTFKFEKNQLICCAKGFNPELEIKAENERKRVR